jgi:hypothetical protein
MVTIDEVGKAGLIIQYEDLISMIGFNIAKQFRSNNLSEKLAGMSIQEVLASYLDRQDEDYSVWLKKEFDIDVNPDDMLSSFLSMQPNLLYSYKVFPASHNERNDNLYIYSDKYSKICEECTSSYGFKGVEYIHGDIYNFIKEHPNTTFITASTKSIDVMRTVNTPVCLVVCDDYQYTIEHMTKNKIDKELSDKSNIILRYTSIVSGGII